MKDYISSREVIGQPIQAIRFGLTECVIYLANGRQVLIEPVQFNADCKKGNPYAGVQTTVV